MYRLLLILPFVVITGCATSPDGEGLFAPTTGFKALEVGPYKYAVEALGAAVQNKNEVEAAFLRRERQLCGGPARSHDYRSEPYQYYASTGTYNAFKTTGTIQCDISKLKPPVPVAIVRDSAKPISDQKAELFYLKEINGESVRNSREVTLVSNQGRGSMMTPEVVERNVPAAATTYTIEGRTEYAAPILALSNKVFRIGGKVIASLVPYRTYEVRGVLEESHSAVWIEDVETHEIVGKLEESGSTELKWYEK